MWLFSESISTLPSPQLEGLTRTCRRFHVEASTWRMGSVCIVSSDRITPIFISRETAGHLEGVPQPQELGTKTITMVINHLPPPKFNIAPETFKGNNQPHLGDLPPWLPSPLITSVSRSSQSLRSMTKVATLTGHTYRVLYLAISPDGQTVVTGAGDETLRREAEGG